MRAEERSRPLSQSEKVTLRGLLARPFTGRESLLAQIEHARASGACGCGCPTIDIVVDETSVNAASLKVEPVPVEAYIDDADGRHHEIILFVRNGYLSGLELVTQGDPVLREWPDLGSARVIVYEEPTWSDGT